MKCSEANELMMKYFDGELNDLDFYHLKQHTRSCVTCSNEFETMSEMIDFMEEQPLLDPPQGFEAKVMKAINAETAKKQNYISAPLKLVLAIMATGLLVLTAWIVLILQSVSVFELVGITINSGFSFDLFANIFEAFHDGYKTAIILGDSIFGVYYILLKNYYDVMISMAAILIIAYSMFSRMTRQQY